MRKGLDAYRQETQLADLCSKEACKVNTCRSNCTEHTNVQTKKRRCGVSPVMFLVQTLQHAFPRSDWIIIQAATAQYHLRNFDAAEDLFEDLLARDPHCIEVPFSSHTVMLSL